MADPRDIALGRPRFRVKAIGDNGEMFVDRISLKDVKDFTAEYRSTIDPEFKPVPLVKVLIEIAFSLPNRLYTNCDAKIIAVEIERIKVHER